MNLNLMSREGYEEFMGSILEEGDNLNLMEEEQFEEYITHYSPLGWINDLHKMAYLVNINSNSPEDYKKLSNIHLLVGKLDQHLTKMARKQINKESK